jgi:hypothetical protein
LASVVGAIEDSSVGVRNSSTVEVANGSAVRAEDDSTIEVADGSSDGVETLEDTEAVGRILTLEVGSALSGAKGEEPTGLNGAR